MKFDFIIVGSGFGGSVSAMRLAQKGYSVLVLEKGKRYQTTDFPKSNWNVFKFLWAPILKCFGIQQITLLKGVMVLHGSGVGGGSLVYANTLMEPHPEVFKSWPQGRDWLKELAPHYQTAKKMLGVERNPILEESDHVLKELSERMGFGDSYHPTDVGIYFGKSGQKHKDPYFSGQGPERVGCTGCGACMIGCRVGAKNTLDKNYLYFAEKWGVQVLPEQKVSKIEKTQSGYKVYSRTISKYFSKDQIFESDRVILSAGVIGTVDILFRNKEKFKTLPNISEALGTVVRTNGESLLGATSFEHHRDLSKGIAIGSAFHPDSQTKIEAVRYPRGSNLMKLLAVPLTGSGNFWTRPLKMIFQILKRFPQFLKLLTLNDWAKNTVILLVMQSIDVKMRLKMGKFFLTGSTDQGSVPSYIPIAQSAAQMTAQIVHGEPQNVFSEVLLQTPATAHILGGCPMGSDPKNSVVDLNQQVHGYEGLYVCDGSVIASNLGVNPSLTITAISEKFCEQFAIKNLETFHSRKITFGQV